MEAGAEVAERVKKVLANVSKLLKGCSPAEDAIQSLLDRLGAEVYEAVSTDAYVRHQVSTVVDSLCQCSDRLLDAHAIEDVLRVEVVKRFFLSSLQNFTVPLAGLAYLQRLTEERNHLNKEVLAYGYGGMTLTRTGSLQIETTKLIDSGKIALQYACVLEPLLVDEFIIFWFWDHFRRIGACFYNMGEYEGSVPWHEAALKVAKLTAKMQAAISNFDLGNSLLGTARHSADTEKKEERSSRGLTHLKHGIALLENETLDDADMAGRISRAHDSLGRSVYLERKDFSLALPHLAKAVEIAATHNLHAMECQAALNYGTVLSVLPDRLGEARASYRRGLEAVLKVIPWTAVPLQMIHTATIYERDVLLQSIQRSEWRYNLPLLWIYPELWSDLPTSSIVARARAQYILGYDYYYDRDFDRGVEKMLNGLRILEAERRTDQIGHHTILSGVIHCTLGEIYYETAKYEEAAAQFHHCGQLHDIKLNNQIRFLEGRALSYWGEHVRALAVFKELLLQSSSDSDLWKQRAQLLAWKGLAELMKGDIDECILSMLEARKAHEEENPMDIQNLLVMHINLLQAYLKKHQYRDAFHLVRIFQPIIDEHKGDCVWQAWQALKAAGHKMVGDLRSEEDAMELVNDPDLITVLDVTDSRSIELTALTSRSSVYRSQADVDSALECYDQMEELIRDSEGEGPQGLWCDLAKRLHHAIIPGEIHLNRAAVLLLANDNKADLQRACQESQQAALLFRKEGGKELLLARALACQAAVMLNLNILMRDNQVESKITEKLIEEAIGLAETRDSLLLAQCKHIKAKVHRGQNPFAAEAEGRAAVLIFAEHQLQLRDMESAWVSMFGSEMKHLFIFMQVLSMVDLNMPMKALLWAERGRTRLFVYIVRKEGATNSSNVQSASDYAIPPSKRVEKLQDDLQHVQLQNNPGNVSSWKEDRLGEADGEICDGFQLVNKSTSNLSHEPVKDTHDNFENAAEFSGLDELWFDKDDTLAEKYLFQALEQCGPEALILEYTYMEQYGDKLLIYGVLLGPGGGHEVKCTEVNVQALIEKQRDGKTKWVWGRTLTSLISKTREYIVRKADNEAMEGLNLLHSVLIEPVETSLQGCQRLILSTHEQLAMVPFAALFNKQTGKFLVQEKTISYIPSIRVLHYCFHRQRVFERQMQKGLLDIPFVAGNPEPMGWGMEPLPGAAEEAKVVAEMLGVRPCIGVDVTKESVTAGLSKASMVLLATHGVVNTYFPHGALILQACSSRAREEESSSTSLARNLTRGLGGPFFQRLRGSPNGDVSGNSAITSDELVSLPTNGIRAGLVVLSACKSGEGEVTSEGLLGLGRALLQGGAPAAILTLWEVADSSNTALVAGVFEQLVRHRKDAAESLRHSMLQMMDSKETKYHIFHWAPLVVLGTPFFKYVPGIHSEV